MKTAKIKSRLNGLALLRKQLGVSQGTMAIYLHVNLSTVKLAELGERSLPIQALAKVARMQILLKDKPQQIKDHSIHPAEQVYTSDFRSGYEQLFEVRYKIQYDSHLLERKLDSMIVHYKKTREKLQILETVLPGIDNDGLKNESLERQHGLAKRFLVTCGLPAQSLLKCRIALMKAQIELYDSMEKKLKENMPAFLFNDPGN